jgi:hypothetical protein
MRQLVTDGATLKAALQCHATATWTDARLPTEAERNYESSYLYWAVESRMSEAQ